MKLCDHCPVGGCCFSTILYDLCENGVPGKDVIKHWFESEPGPEETL